RCFSPTGPPPPGRLLRLSFGLELESGRRRRAVGTRPGAPGNSRPGFRAFAPPAEAPVEVPLREIGDSGGAARARSSAAMAARFDLRPTTPGLHPRSPHGASQA